MKKLLLMLLIVVSLTSCDFNSNKKAIEPFLLSKHDVTNYEETTYYLDVYLDDNDDRLEVEGEIVYVNEDMDYDELYITIYPNAYSRFGQTNNVNIEYLQVNGEEVVYEIRGEDNSQYYIVLDETIEKGENFSVSFKYDFDYWDIDRIVAIGDYYQTMFFYPFVAKYDDAGWNIDPYTFSGESYYNDIGDYYVTLTVDKSFEVASSGKLIAEEKMRNIRIQYLYLDNGRDFSFSASPDYEVYNETINERDYSIYSIRELTDLEISESFTYLELSFELYEEKIGDYYYDYFTLEYGHIYGMESSGIIYCSEEISEGTVVHEVVHQFFYSIIGNDQSDYSFLDESLTTYISGYYYDYRYGEGASVDYFNYRTSLSDRFTDRYQAQLGESLLRKVPEFGGEYGFLIYYHGPALFKYYTDVILEGDLDIMYESLSEYYDMYHGKIASLEGFLDILEENSAYEDTKEWFMMQLEEVQDFDNRP